MKVLKIVIATVLIWTITSFADVVGDWRFETHINNKYYDASMNNLPARGTLSVTKGLVGNALNCRDSFEVIVDSSHKYYNYDQFTIEMMIYSNVDLVTAASFENYKHLFDFVDISSTTYAGYSIYITSEGRLEMSVGATNKWVVVTSPSTLQKQTWYHVTGTYDGQFMKLYINGELIASKLYSGSYQLCNGDARIGCQTLTDGRVRNCFNGLLDELRLHNTALTDADIATRYNQLMNGPQEKLIAFWSFDSKSGEFFPDSSGNGYNARGMLGLTNGFLGNALDCKGTFEIVVDSSHSGLNLDQFTVEALIFSNVNLIANPSFDNYRQIFDFVNINTATYGGYSLYITSEGRFEMGIATTNKWEVVTTPFTLQPKKWYHLLASFDGQVMSLYVDGQKASSREFIGPYVPSNRDLRIGSQTLNNGNMRNWFDGKIDEVKVYNFAFDSLEVSSRYSELLLNSPEPQKKMAHWSFDSSAQNIFYDISGSGFHAVGEDLGLSDGVSGKALYCSTDSFELIVPNSKGAFNTDNFTVDAWIYSEIDIVNIPSFYNYRQIFNFLTIGPSTSGGYALYITAENTLELGIGSNNGSLWEYAISPKDKILEPRKWYHVAGTYDGTNLNLYLNGELIATRTTTNGYKPSTYDARIGSQRMTTGEVRNWFKGRIDELTLRNYALTTQEISDYYNSTKPDPEPQFKINLGSKTTYALPGDTVWMPIYLTNYEDFSINACQFNIRIDTSKAKIINIVKDSGIVKDWLFSWNGTPANNVSVALGGVGTALTYGDGEIVRCKIAVKPTVSSSDTCFLNFNNIVIDETNKLVTATSQPGKIIFKTPSVLLGDVTANNQVNVFDAQKILAYVVGAIETPDPSCPNLNIDVADVSGNGTISSYDAALVFQHSVGLLPEFPAAKIRSLFKGASETVIPATLSIAVTNQSATGGTTFTVKGNNLKGFIAGEFSIKYNPNIVSIDNGDLQTPLRGASYSTKADPVQNLLKVAITTNDYINDNNEVMLFSITLPPVNSSNPLSAFELATALINEGRIPSDITTGGLLPVKVPKNPAFRNGVVKTGNNLIILSEKGKVSHIKIYTLNGRQIFAKTVPVSNGTSQISLSSLAPGLYFYRVQTGTHKFSGRLPVSR